MINKLNNKTNEQNFFSTPITIHIETRKTKNVLYYEHFSNALWPFANLVLFFILCLLCPMQPIHVIFQLVLSCSPPLSPKTSLNLSFSLSFQFSFPSFDSLLISLANYHELLFYLHFHQLDMFVLFLDNGWNIHCMETL